jgi:hypothetical protein
MLMLIDVDVVDIDDGDLNNIWHMTTIFVDVCLMYQIKLFDTYSIIKLIHKLKNR